MDDEDAAGFGLNITDMVMEVMIHGGDGDGDSDGDGSGGGDGGGDGDGDGNGDHDGYGLTAKMDLVPSLSCQRVRLQGDGMVHQG